MDTVSGGPAPPVDSGAPLQRSVGRQQMTLGLMIAFTRSYVLAVFSSQSVCAQWKYFSVLRSPSQHTHLLWGGGGGGAHATQKS